jgi:hypothetical protein
MISRARVHARARKGVCIRSLHSADAKTTKDWAQSIVPVESGPISELCLLFARRQFSPLRHGQPFAHPSMSALPTLLALMR